MPRSDTGGGLWLAFEHRLLSTLMGFDPGEFAIIEDRNASPAQYVQFALQAGNALQGECAGPKRSGGTADWTSSQERALEQMGWGPVDERGGWSNYRIIWHPSRPGGRLSQEDAEDAAHLTRRTFEEVCRTYNPLDLLLRVDAFDAGNGTSGSQVQARFTGSERRALIEALRFHQQHGPRTSDGFGSGGLADFFKTMANLAEDVLLASHHSLIEYLEANDAVAFDAKTSLLLVEAIDLYQSSSPAPGTARALIGARSKVD